MLAFSACAAPAYALPPAPTGLATSPHSPSNNPTPVITGTSAAGTVKLYTKSDCSGSVIGSGSASAFASPGITVSSLGPDANYTIYAQTTDVSLLQSPCSTGVSYTLDTAAPSAPAGLASNPTSPSNQDITKVIGTAEAGSSVHLYFNGTCNGAPIASDTAGSFASPGFSISVPDNVTSVFSATTTDPAGNTSGRSSG